MAAQIYLAAILGHWDISKKIFVEMVSVYLFYHFENRRHIENLGIDFFKF
jgi:hypothetical protein